MKLIKFEKRYEKKIPIDKIAKCKKMARKGKGWGWRRHYMGELKKNETK